MTTRVINRMICMWLFIVANVSSIRAQEKADFERWVKEADEVIESVDSYTAIFHRQVRVNGELKDKETMFFKYKKPYKLYLKWIENPYKGRECLYVEGENNNRIKIHGGGIFSFITWNIDPFSPIALKGSRHPVNEAGIEYITRIIGKELRRGIENNEIEFISSGEEIVYWRKTRNVESIFPKDRSKGYYCYRAVINLDIELKVPIKIEVYNYENQLIESYGFENLILNAELTDADFDFRNPEYKF